MYKNLTMLVILFPLMLLAQPVLEIMYPLPIDSAIAHGIRLPDSSYYVNTPFLSQSLDPAKEMFRFAIIDTTTDTIYAKPFNMKCYYDSIIWFCDTLHPTSTCPCEILMTISDNIPMLLRVAGFSPGYTYSLTNCDFDLPAIDTVFSNQPCTNINMKEVTSGRFEFWGGAYIYPGHLLWFPRPGHFSHGWGPLSFNICSFCNDRDHCSDFFGVYGIMYSPTNWSGEYNAELNKFFPTQPEFKFEWTSFYLTLPEELYIDVACFARTAWNRTWRDTVSFHFALDSTSAWMTVTWLDGAGADTFFYGDSGISWRKPHGKHLGWRRFGIPSDLIHIPDGYMGNVHVCLHEVTNAPVIAFGEPTHLHPAGMPCYGNWEYYDSLLDTTFIVERCIPTPAVPVCTTFFVITDIIEAGEVHHNIGLEVNNSFGDLNEIYYSLPSNGIIAIYNIMGRVVLKREVSGSGVIKVEAGELSSGIYFAVIKSADYDKIVRRVLVVR